MRYPKRLLTEDEEILRMFRPHWRVLLPVVGWALLLGGLAAAVIIMLGQQYTVIAGGVAFGLWLLLSARRLFNWWFTGYVLTTERIIVRRGWIARTGTEIPLESINNVLFSQRVIERLLGYGDILIESAGQQGQSRVADIPNPEAFQAEVYAAREMRALHFSGGAARDAVAQLESLADLRERGHLTDAEFEAKKRRLLGDGAPAGDAAPAGGPDGEEVPYES